MSVLARRKERVRTTLQQRIGHSHSRYGGGTSAPQCQRYFCAVRSRLAVMKCTWSLENLSLSKGAARGSERWLELNRHERLADCVSGLKSRGFRLYVADLDGAALSPEQVPVDQPIAVLFGSELEGVSEQARHLADGFVTVPMRGLTESLNVSVAAACILQRVTERRRHFMGGGDLSIERQEAFYEAWLEREDVARRGMRARAGLGT